MGVAHAGFGIGRGLLLYGEGRLGVIQIGLCRCRSGLRLLELGLALGLHRSCGGEGCLCVRDLLLCRIVLRTAGTGLRCGEVGFRLLVGGAGGCGLRIRRVLVLLGCGEDGICGILCRLGRDQLGLGIGKRRVGVGEFVLCLAHGILGVAHGLLGGTDCLRGGTCGIGLGFIEGVLGVLGRLEGGLVCLVLLGCIRLGVCKTRLRLLEVLAGGIGGVLALCDLAGVLVHRRTVGCRAGADRRIIGCLGGVAGGSSLVVGAGGLIVGCLGGVLLRLRLVGRLLQVRDGLCGGFRAGMDGDRRHHGGVLRATVTGLGECRERRDEARSGHGGHGRRGDGQTCDPLRGVKLFAWQCGEVIATGSSLSHCYSIPFLCHIRLGIRALSNKGNYAPQLGLLYIVRWHKYNNP